MNKKGILKLMILIVVLLVVGFFWFIGNRFSRDVSSEEICVPASCCHPTECVLESEAPNCTNMICTTECKPGTLDCGQGHCEFVDGKCEAIIDE